jgi:hypothetical protein
LVADCLCWGIRLSGKFLGRNNAFDLVKPMEIEMRFSALAFVACMLGGCAGSIVGDAIRGPEKLAQDDDAYCKSIGLSFGTPDYAKCRMMRDQARQAHHDRMLGVAATGLAIAATPPPAPSSVPGPLSTPQNDMICRPMGGDGSLRCN